MNPIELDEVAAAPIVLRVKRQDGTTAEYKLPKLGVRAYGPWLRELTQKRRDAAKAALPKVPGRDRFAAEKMVELDRATFDDVFRELGNEEGITRLLALSMEQAGVPDADRQLILDKLPAFDAILLARELSTLYAPAPSDEPQQRAASGQEGGKPADPLASQPSSGPTATVPTG